MKWVGRLKLPDPPTKVPCKNRLIVFAQALHQLLLILTAGSDVAAEWVQVWKNLLNFCQSSAAHGFACLCAQIQGFSGCVIGKYNFVLVTHEVPVGHKSKVITGLNAVQFSQFVRGDK
jgi:hypothetical protein